MIFIIIQDFSARLLTPNDHEFSEDVEGVFRVA